MKRKPPSDIAIALEFDPDRMNAPRVTGFAERLRVKDVLSMARRYGIPLEENSELASALFELDEHGEIPEDLYTDVAKLFASIKR